MSTFWPVTRIVPADVHAPSFSYCCHSTERPGRSAPVMEPLLWRMGSLKRPSAYGGCTSRTVIGMVAFWKIG